MFRVVSSHQAGAVILIKQWDMRSHCLSWIKEVKLMHFFYLRSFLHTHLHHLM